jgi:hypothetical protein
VGVTSDGYRLGNRDVYEVQGPRNTYARLWVPSGSTSLATSWSRRSWS